MNHAIRAHSECGASGAYRWINCPGSVALYRTLPEDRSKSIHAERGTKLHEYLEKFVEQTIEYKKSGTPVTVTTDDDEVKYLAQFCWDILYKEVFDEAITGKHITLEKRLDLFKEFEMFGTVDLVSLFIDSKGKRSAFIVDYKFGFVDVSIEDNLQIAFYASALYLQSVQAKKPLETIHVAILQPSSETPWKKDIYTQKQLEAFVKKFKKAAEDIYIKKNTKVKTGSWCSYCKAKTICPSYRKELVEKSSLTVLEEDTMKLPDIEKLPVETLIKIYEHSGELKSFLTNVEEHLMKLAFLGNLPGYKIVEGKSRRAWKEDIDTAKLVETLEVYPFRQELIPITTLEKVLSKQGKKDLQQFLEAKPTKNKLVREDEPGKPITSVFDALE